LPKMTGSKLCAEVLRGYGVTHVFFVPAILLKTLAEMEDMNIRRIMTHGEKSAAYMADGYARASGRPGVCIAQAVGASNLAAGLRDALMALAGWKRSGLGPLIYVFSPSGAVLETHPVPADLPLRCAFGDVDLGSLYVTTGEGHLYRAKATRRRGVYRGPSPR